MSVDVSFVLPSYRGADVARRQVPLLLEYLRTVGLDHEVILVDDGSRDGGETQRVAESLGCRYLENPKNQGKGAAVRRGMLAATGRYRFYTDIDVPYELANIEAMLWYLDFKEFHFVAGDRTLDESSYHLQVPWLRRAASHVYSTVVGRLVAGGWFDTQCGLKGFRDHVAKDLFSVGRINRFAFDVELFYIALKRNYDIKRLPVRLRCNETSTVDVLRDGAAMVRDLGAIRLNQLFGRYRPLLPVQRTVDSSPRANAAPRKVTLHDR
ncbi:MAG: glycosyltransferase [Deltaproteobacteria bacterium]|nr:glycosyltransferase [Deltaproteobacteria bacterium]